MYYLATVYMVRFSRNIKQPKQIYSCEANGLGVVLCSYNERTNRLCVYICLLTNHLHGKAAELCLAEIRNRVTTTKYMEYINSTRHVFTACLILFITWGW